jgi:tetratricopeptide (TPR) repeat protein
MAGHGLSDRVNDLFRKGEWAKARKLLEAERKRNPNDHWVLTQLGVTYYEQKRYAESLALFLASRNIVPDCPLTLWNLAGALDALGEYTAAKDIYLWLLEADRSPADDACWESSAWADALRADAVYRLGITYEHLGERRKAEQFFRQYLDLLLTGIEGTYSAEDVTRRVRALHGTAGNNGAGGRPGIRFRTALRRAGIGRRPGRLAPPTVNETELLASHCAAGKR